jgi:hypothetical protein
VLSPGWVRLSAREKAVRIVALVCFIVGTIVVFLLALNERFQSALGGGVFG